MKKYFLWLLVTAVFSCCISGVSYCQTTGLASDVSPERVASVAAASQKVSLKIMPLGDSITFGTRDSSYGGYRHLLGTLLPRP